MRCITYPREHPHFPDWANLRRGYGCSGRSSKPLCRCYLKSLLRWYECLRVVFLGTWRPSKACEKRVAGGLSAAVAVVPNSCRNAHRYWRHGLVLHFIHQRSIAIPRQFYHHSQLHSDVDVGKKILRELGALVCHRHCSGRSLSRERLRALRRFVLCLSRHGGVRVAAMAETFGWYRNRTKGRQLSPCCSS